LGVSLPACKSSSNSRQTGEEYSGDDYLGYLIVPDGWIAIKNPWEDEQYWEKLGYDENYLRYFNPADQTYVRDGLMITSLTDEADIFLNIYKSRCIDEVLYSYRVTPHILPDNVFDWEESIVTLDNSLLDPVYRLSYTSVGGIPYDGYGVSYIFVGFDGLLRTVDIRASSEEMFNQAIKIFDTFTFNYDSATDRPIPIVQNSLIDRQVLAEYEGVTVTLLDFYEIPAFGSQMILMIEKTDEQDIGISIDNSSINGIRVRHFDTTFDESYSPFIRDGETEYMVISVGFPLRVLEEDGIDRIKEIEFSVQIVTTDSYRQVLEILYETEILNFKVAAPR